MSWSFVFLLFLLFFLIVILFIHIFHLERNLKRLNEQLNEQSSLFHEKFKYYDKKTYSKLQEHDSILKSLPKRPVSQYEFVNEQVKLESLQREVQSINGKICCLIDIVQERKIKSINELSDRL